jgi:hypothetical protein
MNRGDGTLEKAVNYEVGNDLVNSVVAWDLNEHGRPDLAATCAGPWAGCHENEVFVLVNRGDGTFEKGLPYDTGGPMSSLLLTSDFNGDGKPDLVAAKTRCGESCLPGIFGLLNKGDGTFDDVGDHGGNDGDFYYLVASDFNGDGRMDLAVAERLCGDSGCAGGVYVYFGRGDGTFDSPITVAYRRANLNEVQKLSVDFNGDGRPDIAQVDADGISILLDAGNGTHANAGTYPVLTTSLVSFDLDVATGDPISVSVDLNGDGEIDLATPNGAVLLGRGDGTFEVAGSYVASGSPSIKADLDGDGLADYIDRDTGGILVGLVDSRTPFRVCLEINAPLSLTSALWCSSTLHESVQA